MKVLWLSNQMPPAVARILGKEAGNKEGWLTGLLEGLLRHREENGLELGLCFPIAPGSAPVKGSTEDFSYYGFYEDAAHPEKYDVSLEKQIKDILQEFAPDIVHCFGTEYPHTLAMSRVCEDKRKLLVGIQGLCFKYADYYMADLPKKIQKRYLLRDFLKRDNLILQQKKYILRGNFEKEALKNVRHVTGRTDWDRAAAAGVNPQAEYHFMNESLRPVFYEARWEMENCEKYSIFLSQGNYPIKGLHYLLNALPDILKRYPQTKVYVAGDVITRYNTLMEKIKIGSYGKYCLDLIKKQKLEDRVCFLGKLDSRKMCERYLKSHVFLSPSAIENSPNSVGEAMLLGMPVVSSAEGGVTNLLKDGEEGLLYPYQDLKALAEAVIRIFSNDEEAACLGNKAREHALRTHDPEINYRRLLEIYGELA